MNFPKGRGIYAIRTPNKIYLGMTSDSFDLRWKSHLRDLRKGIHSSPSLQNLYSKYGEKYFIFGVVSYMNDSSAAEIAFEERRLWRIWDNDGIKLHNSIPSGTVFPTFIGRKHSDKTKEKIAIAAQNRAKQQKDNWPTINCSSCGNIFRSKASWNRIFCSRTCYISGSGSEIAATSKEILENLYLKEARTAIEIAKYFNCSLRTVRLHLKKHNITKNIAP